MTATEQAEASARPRDHTEAPDERKRIAMSEPTPNIPLLRYHLTADGRALVDLAHTPTGGA